MSKRIKRGRPVRPKTQQPQVAQRQDWFSRRRVLRWAVLAGVVAVLVWHHGAWLPAIPVWKARRALAQRNLDSAHAWLDMAKRVAPSDPEIEFLRARTFRKQGEFNKVREHLQRAYDLGMPRERIEREEWLALAQSGQLRKAVPYLYRLLYDPQEDGQEILEAFVNGYFQHYRYSEAFTLLDVWIKDFPNDPVPLFYRGRIHAKLQEHKFAEENLRRAWELDTAYYEAAYELADVLWHQNQPDEALRIFKQCGDAAAEMSEKAQIGEIKCLKMLGRPDEARRILQKLLVDNPAHAEALIEIGRLDLEAGRYTDSVRWLQQAHDQSPRDVEVWYALASALRGAGELKEAEFHFNAVKQARVALSQIQKLTDLVVKNSKDIESRYKIGIIHLNYGSSKEGAIWLQSVLDYDENHKPTLEALAKYYEGRSEESPKFAELAKRYRGRTRNETPSATDVKD